MTKVIDARGLEPPQPFELAMDAIADLQKGEGFLLLLDRMPHPLLRLLDRDGYRHESRVQDDGTVEVRIDYP
jgi:TusA-related sulfurtransferase